jgi:hypothetical protein
MDDDRFERLTLKQCDCLRLIGEGHSEKLAAQALGVTPYAVRERLRAARKTLGLDDSWVAGRQYLTWRDQRNNIDLVGFVPVDPPNDYTRFVDVDVSLAPQTGTGPLQSVANQAAGDDQYAAGTELRERRVGYEFDRTSTPKHIWRSLFPPIGRRANDLGISDRSILIMVIVVGFGILAMLAYGIFISASRSLVEISRHGG